MIRLLVADAYPVVRSGLVAMLSRDPEITVSAEVSTGPEAVELALTHQPDLIVMELNLPEWNGVEVIRRLRAAGCGARVLVFTMHNCDCTLLEAVEAGASGYLLKTAGADEILQAVRLVAAGGTLLDATQMARMFRHIREAATADTPLTERERGVLRLMVEGLRNKEISDQLGITERTVKFHAALIYQKLGVSSRAEAVAAALKRNLISA